MSFIDNNLDAIILSLIFIGLLVGNYFMVKRNNSRKRFAVFPGILFACFFVLFWGYILLLVSIGKSANVKAVSLENKKSKKEVQTATNQYIAYYQSQKFEQYKNNSSKQDYVTSIYYFDKICLFQSLIALIFSFSGLLNSYSLRWLYISLIITHIGFSCLLYFGELRYFKYLFPALG